jgi:ribosomal protein S18 acetylase RimI-like enzyme
MEIKIRYLTKEDLDTLKGDIIEMWSNHHLNNRSLIAENILQETDIKTYFKNSIDQDKGFSLIATVDKDIAGIIRVEEEILEDFFTHDKAYKVDDLVIKKSFRRKGIATALLDKVKEIAKKNKVGLLKARVYRFNEPAQDFFTEKEFDQLYGEYFHTID